MTTSVLVPASLTREAEDKREATRKVGYVARAATVFRVDRLTVYPDSDGVEKRGAGFVETVLRYAATPPYLRKEVWDRRGELEYAGVLPALRQRSRTGSGSDESGSLRQGIVTEVGADGRVRVNCGLQHPVSLPVPSEMEVGEGERVSVRVSSRRPVRAKLVDEPAAGFVVDSAEIDDALARPDAGLTIAASRYGEELTVTKLDQLVARLRGGDDGGTSGDGSGGSDDTDASDDEAAPGDLTVAFGAPERGLPPILGEDPEAVAAETGDDRFDLWLNTVPDQGSEVVRTEEAVFATLAPLRLTR
ncbi:putative RNA uridine N3 methyltransferase [Halosimplex marinum]|uniref:putative RNA uridine N3 methyltransferase n=1 Tax=Halosimplex marinum TaxID=3396620 RepID=UPI003F5505C9